MLSWTKQNAHLPNNIHVLPYWRLPSEGTEDPNGLDPGMGAWLLGLLDRSVPIPHYLAWEPVQKRGNTVFGQFDWVADCSEARGRVASLALDLRENPTVGVAVECHFDEVRVVQLASARHCVLLDATALAHVMHELLQPLMMDPQVWKVFHDHDNVVLRLLHTFEIFMPPDQFLDLANYAPSLQFLCEAYLHYDLDESYKTADWSVRPLSAEMLEYAAIDAQLLLRLKDECALGVQVLGDGG